MYRLLKIKNFSYCKIKTLNSFVRDDGIQKLCSHCNDIHMRPGASTRFLHGSFPRGQSTETSSAVNENNQSSEKPKRKKVLKRKTFAEILAVTGYSSNETKAKIQKMGAAELERFLAIPQMQDTKTCFGNDLRKKKEQSISTLRNPLFDAMHYDAEREFQDAVKVMEKENASYLHANALPATPAEKISKKALRAEQKKEQDAAAEKLDVESRTEAVTKTLLSYLDACVTCGFLNKAFVVLNNYRERTTIKSSRLGKLTDTELFNTLLRGYAGVGNFKQVCEIMDIMQYDQIEPNIGSYIACFDCVGRMEPTFQSSLLLKEWLKQMAKKNWTLQTMFDEGIFSSDQKIFVIEACRRAESDFTPQVKPEIFDYNCQLLKNLDPVELANSKRLSNVMPADVLRKKAAAQVELESKGSLVIKSVERCTQPPEVTQYYRDKLEKVQEEWKKVVKASFYRDLHALQTRHHGNSRQITIYPFLKALSVDEYVNIILKEIRKLAEGSETFSPSMHILFKEAGVQVQSRYQVLCKTRAGVVGKMETLYMDYCDWFADSDSESGSNTRVKWQQLLQKYPDGASVHGPKLSWPGTIQMSIGKFLYEIILKDIKLDVHMLKENSSSCHVLPAIYSLFRSSGKIIKEEIKPHPVLAKLYRGAAQETLEFVAPLVPMVSPPIPWTDISHGGHLIVNTEIMRLPFQAVSQWKRMESTPRQKLYPAFDTLNQLGSIPWRINEPMLDVITQVFSSGGSAELDIPEPPSSLTSPDQISLEMSKTEKMEIYKQRLSVRRQKAEMYSLWCDTLYRLSLANHYRKEIFWFPHNMDFRGRVYPCPPHLNHMGSDLARSILCFAKGEPLRDLGVDWLKIHVINLTGLKKRDSKAERLRYANEILPDILDSADNPLDGRKWWVKSDEPWQTLAGCMEVAKAIRSPNPKEYISFFPIHQDGSCNGLQHYAALGRDAAGAESVNLAPAETPQDVYSCVVALVERERVKDALNGLKIAQVLDGIVKRKVIKQTVMTTVYGVTRYGARLQIAKQLKDVDKFPTDLVWQASHYLVAKTFESLREMFTSTKEIQDWFTESARLISQTRGQNVEWVTPLGLPIVQPYTRDTKKKSLNSKGNSSFIQENYSMDAFGRPNVMKQKNAFPPNFIHSLDSSHMMLTSLHCEQKGMTFVSVHDCFWTHPSTVDAMNLICRQQFVALHSEPILEELSRSLVEKFSYEDNGWALSNECQHLNDVLTKVPPKGEFDLSKVLDSIYFFS